MRGLKEKVFEALDNARDNGYDQVEMEPVAVAVDLTTCDAELELEELSTLIPLIREWQSNARASKGSVA